MIILHVLSTIDQRRDTDNISGRVADSDQDVPYFKNGLFWICTSLKSGLNNKILAFFDGRICILFLSRTETGSTSLGFATMISSMYSLFIAHIVPVFQSVLAVWEGEEPREVRGGRPGTQARTPARSGRAQAGHRRHQAVLHRLQSASYRLVKRKKKKTSMLLLCK